MVLVWTVSSVLGVALLAAPDDDRVVSFSEGHGPGVVDLLGVASVTVGWAALDGATWARRHQLRLSGRWLLTLVLLAVALAGVGAWSVFADAGAWWLLAAVLLAGGQVALAARAGVFAR